MSASSSSDSSSSSPDSSSDSFFAFFLVFSGFPFVFDLAFSFCELASVRINSVITSHWQFVEELLKRIRQV